MTDTTERTPAQELREAVLALREGGEPLTREAIKPLTEWLDACWDDLTAVGQAADMYKVDPLTLVDEPGSVRHALAVARVLNGGAA
jgi:hypothetical protein